jgi:hypothetical protein
MIDLPSTLSYLSFFNMRQRTIYEYHRVEINMSQIVNTSSVIITPLKSCISMKTCFSCVRATTFLKDFNCNWCPSLAHCSDGLDRKRQEWLGHGCDKRSASTEEQCAAKDFNAMQSIAPSSGVGIAGVVLLSMLLILILSIMVWVVYAYRNPTTRSGLWLIEHHPGHIVTGIRNMFVRLRGGLTSSNKYQVAMQPEVESLA